MWDLARFAVDELESCSRALRSLDGNKETLEETAQELVELLHDGFRDETGRLQTALVRFYKTHPFAELPEDVAAAVDVASGSGVDGRTPCLTLLGSAGVEADWCDRRRSAGHKAIPITSKESVERLPMVARLFADLDLDPDAIGSVSAPQALRLHHRTYDVFHVDDARGSPCVPAQDFVERYGIRSVVGVGGVVPSGDAFAVLLFATVPVDAEVAGTLRSLAPAVKAAVVRRTYAVFRGP